MDGVWICVVFAVGAWVDMSREHLKLKSGTSEHYASVDGKDKTKMAMHAATLDASKQVQRGLTGDWYPMHQKTFSVMPTMVWFSRGF